MPSLEGRRPDDDTSPRARALQVELWRSMTPLDKARAVSRASRSVRELAIRGVRQRFPSASDAECRMRYAILTLGRDLAGAAYPEARGLRGR